MAARKAEIIEAAQRAITLYDQWQADPHANEDIPEECPLDDAFVVLIETCEVGNVPESCRELIIAASRLQVEYERYRDGSFVVPSKAPLQSFYSADEEFVRAFDVAEGPKRRYTEPVHVLREQKVSDAQIAIIYGKRRESDGVWFGPFFDRHGNHIPRLIQQECDKSGSVIGPDFVHPLDVADEEQRKRETATRLRRLRKQTEDKPRQSAWPDEKIIAYMKEGPNANQVAHVCGIPINRVYDLAIANGLRLDGMDIAKPPMTDDTPTSSQRKTESTKHAEDSEAKMIRDEAIKLAESGRTPPEVRKAINNKFARRESLQSILAMIQPKKGKSEAAATMPLAGDEPAGSDEVDELADLDDVDLLADETGVEAMANAS